MSTVKDNTTYNYITITTEETNVSVTQPVTNIVEVNTPGPIRNLAGGLANNFVLWNGPDSLTTSSLNQYGSSVVLTGSLDVSNGVNVTGSLKVTGSFWMNGNRQFNYGAFSHSGSQSLPGANESASFQYTTVDVDDGVTYTSGSRLNIPHTGIYNIQFSAQLLSDANNVKVYIWLKKNGINIDRTATAIAIQNNQEAVAAWNWVFPFTAGDYAEIAWQSNNIAATLESFSSSGNIPAVPSVIVTVTQIA